MTGGENSCLGAIAPIQTIENAVDVVFQRAFPDRAAGRDGFGETVFARFSPQIAFILANENLTGEFLRQAIETTSQIYLVLWF